MEKVEEKKQKQYTKGQWGRKKRKNTLKKGAKFSYDFIEPIATMTALGFTEKDIGLVFGVTGSAVARWKQRYPDLKTAVEKMRPVAASHLVAQMVRAAIGYDYEDEDINYRTVTNKDGTVVEVQTDRKVKKRHQPANPQLAMFLATNMLKGQFANRFEIEKKELKVNVALSGEEIRQFAGKLMELADEPKVVESKTIDESESL